MAGSSYAHLTAPGRCAEPSGGSCGTASRVLRWSSLPWGLHLLLAPVTQKKLVSICVVPMPSTASG